jgi:hypothetical protein
MRGTAENLGTITANKADVLDPNGNSKAATRGFYTNTVVQDTTFFDFQNKLIDGPNKSELEWFDAINVSLDQTWLEGDAGLSYQMNKEDYRRDFDAKLSTGSRFQGLGIDLNTHVPWGDVNPNFGRVWISGSGGTITTRKQALENHRLTGYYKFDLSELDQNDGLLGNILGSHVITGLWEDARDNSTTIGHRHPTWSARYRSEGDGGRRGIEGTNSATHLTHLVYVSPSLKDQSSSAGANVSNWQTKFEIQPEYTLRILDRDNLTNRATGNLDASTWTNDTYKIEGARSAPSSGLKQNIGIASKALILQSRFFDDHIIGNFGYREDEVEVFSNDNPPRVVDGSRNISKTAFALPDRPTFSSSTQATNWGVVAHVPDEWMEKSLGGLGLSFHFAKSENAQIGKERINLRGENLAPVSGETTEIGLTVDINDWLSIRYNEYETLQLSETSTGLTGSFRPLLQVYADYLSPILRQETLDFVNENLGDWPAAAANPDAILNFEPFNTALGALVKDVVNSELNAEGNERHSIPPSLAFTTDLLSEGKEIEAVANITSNWRLMVNITQQVVSSTNTGTLLKEWIDGEVNPNLASYGEFPMIGDRETINNWLGRNAITAINTQLAEDGAPKTNEIREWRWNLVTNYDFDQDSGLAGFNVGGAYRWQDTVGIGRPLIVVDGAFRPDLANPIYGPTQDRFDAWVGWETGIGTFLGQDTLFRVQLNVRNVFDDTDPIPVRADPDGGIPVIRIPDERTFELRASLSY